jgi:Lrp/AsnC family transcriptional regulator for asnA, asnC and gidA
VPHRIRAGLRIPQKTPKNLRKVDPPRSHGYAPSMAMRSIQQAGGRRPVLDDLDKSIIKALQLDGRRPYAQIGRQLKVPEATVRQRAERLITRGVVQVVGVTDPLAMGFQQPALIGLKVDPGRLDQIAHQIAELEEVTYVVITAGRYDLFCEVVCEDNEHLLRVLTDRFASIDGIRSTATLVELRFVKESYQWGAR